MIEPSNNRTKEWRCNQPWYLNGKHKACEKYQISLIEEITGVKVDKTNKRINLIPNKLEDVNKKISLNGLKTLMVINGTMEFFFTTISK